MQETVLPRTDHTPRAYRRPGGALALSLAILGFGGVARSQSLGTDPGAASTPVGSNAASGATDAPPFQAGSRVSSGAFTTSVPIEVPPFHGLQPKLALAYDSNSRNGILGVGWSLSGTSFIQRASVGRGVPSYDWSDVYLLDGMQLTPCSALPAGSTSPGCSNPAAGAAYTYYFGKAESFRRIATDGSNWYVWDKSGTRYEYRQAWVPNLGSDPYRWMLSAVVDPSGNTVNYFYTCDRTINNASPSSADACYLSSINYNRNTVKLYYQRRSDPFSFAMGRNTTATVRSVLTTIEVAVGDYWGTNHDARAYALNYATSVSSSRAMLSSVVQYGSDVSIGSGGQISGGTAYPSIQLAPVSAAPPGVYYRNQNETHFNDAPASITYPANSFFYDSWQSAPNWISTHGGGINEYLTGSHGFFADVDGDGLDDYILVYPGTNGSYGSSNPGTQSGSTTAYIATFHNTGNGYVRVGLQNGAVNDYQIQQSAQVPFRSSNLPTYYVGDVNHDGRRDLIAVLWLDPSFYPYPTNNELRIMTFSWGPNGIQEKYTDVSVPDFPILQPPCNPTYTAQRTLVGDVNGDGISDLVWVYPHLQSSGAWTNLIRTALGNGDGTFDVGLVPDQDTNWSMTAGSTSVCDGYNKDRWFLGDVNGDGRSDIMAVRYTAGSPSTASLCTAMPLQSSVLGFTSAPYSLSCQSTSLTWGDADWWLSGDVDGDGNTDFMRVLQVNGNNAFQGYVSNGLGNQFNPTSLTATGTPWTANYPGWTPYCTTGGAAAHNNWFAIDLDGDGRSDFAQFGQGAPNGTGDTTAALFWAMNTPTDSTQTDFAFSLLGSRNTSLPYAVGCVDSGLSMSELNGDGRPDIAAFRLFEGGTDGLSNFDARVSLLLQSDLSPRSPGGSPNDSRDAIHWRTGDLNGDGLSDLVYVQALNPGVRVYTRTRNLDGSWSEPAPQDFFTGGFRSLDVANFRIADLNGDGTSDLVYLNGRSPATGDVQVYGILMYAGAPSTSFSYSYQFQSPSPSMGYGDPANWRVIDINGDGAADLVHVAYDRVNGGSIRVDSLLSTNGGNFEPSWSPSWAYVWRNELVSDDASWLPMDVNGDGRMDLVHVQRAPGTIAQTNGTVEIDSLLSNGSGGWTHVSYSLWTDHFINPTQLRMGDVNGDGKHDLLYVYSAQNPQGTYDVYTDAFLGQGDGRFVLKNAKSWAGFDRPDTLSWRAGDFNGDGRTDLIHVRSIPWGQRVDTLSSVDYGFSQTQQANAFWFLNEPRTWQWHVADVNGDGAQDLEQIADETSAGALRVNSLTSASSLDLLGTVQSPSGGTTTISYVPSSGRSLQNPCSVKLPVGAVLQTVGQLTISDGRGGSDVSTYSQSCPVWSYDERGLIGWWTVTEIALAATNRPQRTTTTTYKLDTPACGARPSRVEVQDAGGVLLRREIMDYVPAGTAAPYSCMTQSQTSSECQGSTSCVDTKTNLFYDGVGNVRQKDECGDAAVAGDERTTIQLYNPPGSAYLSTLGEIQVYGGASSCGNTPMPPALSDVKYTYDLQGHALTQSAWLDQANQWLTTSYGYDPQGNRISITDANGHKITTGYDYVYNVYPISVTNAAGESTTYAWDYVKGKQLYWNDPNGQWRDSTTLDPLGRVSNVTNQIPCGANQSLSCISSTSYSYVSFGNPTQQYIQTLTDDGSSSKLWSNASFDGLGRTYHTVKKGNVPIGPYAYHQSTIYSDSSSRPWQKSHVYIGNQTPVYEVSQYDSMGRLLWLTHPDGGSTMTTYMNRHTQTLDERADEKDTFYDAYGRVARVQEFSGGVSTVSYDYDLLDRNTRITDPAGNVQTMVWDSLGRKTKSIDPDLGTWSYAYDGAGNLVTQTNGNNVTLTFTYDAANRKKTKTNSSTGDHVTWNYGETGHGNGVGALTSVVDSTSGACATSEWIWYDVAQRVGAQVKCWDGFSYKTSFGFDQVGRPYSVGYPDGEQLTYSYSAAGQLSSAVGTLNGVSTNYLSWMSYDAEGKLLSSTFGDGSYDRFTYDPNRDWLTDANVFSSSGARLFNAHYTYYPDALVWTSSSTTHQLSSTYYYDGLHRLTTISGDMAQTFSYDLTGNMKYNSLTGTYQYPAAGGNLPHAVQSVGANRYYYDADGNLYAEINGATGNYQRYYSWDQDNRMVWAGVDDPTKGWRWTSMAYDAAGQRVKKSGPNGTIYYFNRFTERDAGGNLVKYYFAGPRLAARRDATGTFYYHADRLGSTRVVTNGSSVYNYNYYAYGSKVGSGNKLADAVLFTGARQDSESAFPGEGPGDAENGLIYLNARYYDPAIARFLSADTVLPGQNDPQGPNRYAYAFNNPISSVDPTGHDPKPYTWDLHLCWVGCLGVNVEMTGDRSKYGPWWRTFNVYGGIGTPGYGFTRTDGVSNRREGVSDPSFTVGAGMSVASISFTETYHLHNGLISGSLFAGALGIGLQLDSNWDPHAGTQTGSFHFTGLSSLGFDENLGPSLGLPGPWGIGNIEPNVPDVFQLFPPKDTPTLLNPKFKVTAADYFNYTVMGVIGYTVGNVDIPDTRPVNPSGSSTEDAPAPAPAE